MTVQPPAVPSKRASVGWFVFVLLACTHFAVLCYWRSEEFLKLDVYARFGERLPYQTRILMAWWLHITAGNPHLNPTLCRVASHLPAQFRDPYIFVLLISVMVTMVISVVATRSTLLVLTGNRRFASWAALLTLYMAYFNLLAVYGLTYTLPYDVPALALFSIAVWLILARKLWWLLPVFVVGTLNRETFCFVTIFLLLITWFEASGQSRLVALRRVAPHLILQTAFWFAIRLWITHTYAHNPLDPGQTSGILDVHFHQNLRSIVNPFQWPLFLSLFGFTLPLLIHQFQWIQRPAFARSIVIVMSLWGLAMLVIGIVVEIRVFDELTAFMAPAIALILWNRWVRPATQHGVTP